MEQQQNQILFANWQRVILNKPPLNLLIAHKIGKFTEIKNVAFTYNILDTRGKMCEQHKKKKKQQMDVKCGVLSPLLLYFCRHTDGR